MTTLGRWLSKHPQPAKLICTMEDGEPKRVAVGLARSKWRDAESACAGAVRVEALDESGASLRAIDLVDPDAPQTLKPASSKESEMVLIASLIKDAYQGGTDALVRAIDKQSELMSMWSQRLAQLEAAWHNLLMSQEPEDVAKMNDMLAQVVMGKLMSGPAKKAPKADKPNGAGKEQGA